MLSVFDERVKEFSFFRIRLWMKRKAGSTLGLYRIWNAYCTQNRQRRPSREFLLEWSSHRLLRYGTPDQSWVKTGLCVFVSLLLLPNPGIPVCIDKKILLLWMNFLRNKEEKNCTSRTSKKLRLPSSVLSRPQIKSGKSSNAAQELSSVCNLLDVNAKNKIVSFVNTFRP